MGYKKQIMRKRFISLQIAIHDAGKSKDKLRPAVNGRPAGAAGEAPSCPERPRRPAPRIPRRQAPREENPGGAGFLTKRSLPAFPARRPPVRPGPFEGRRGREDGNPERSDARYATAVLRPKPAAGSGSRPPAPPRAGLGSVRRPDAHRCDRRDFAAFPAVRPVQPGERL